MNRSKSYLIFAIVATLLVLSWLRLGSFIATGESGLQFYNPSGVSIFYRYTWTDGAIGLPTSYAITSYPFLRVLGFLEIITRSSSLVQGIFFFVMIFMGMVGVYEFCKLIFAKEKDDWSLSLIPPLFYTFNLFALVNIWNRLQYTFIVFYCFLPLGMWIYSKGLIKKELKYGFYLSIAMMPFVLAFSSIPLIELFWLLILTQTGYFLLLDLKTKRHWVFYIRFFFISIFAWVVLNAWWLIQFVFVLKNSAYVTSQAYTSSGNSEAFSLLSSQLGNLSYVFRLMHRQFFLNTQSSWFNSLNSLFIVISFLVPLLAFFPLVLRKKPVIINYFLLMALVSVFLTKGDSPPFGFLFFWAFNHIRLLEAFRNPFEKIGMILPFTYAPLIGYSLYRIREYAARHPYKQKIKISVVITSILFIGFLNFPYWNKLIFSNDYVQVPQYYQQANEYLRASQKTNDPFRAIAVPMSGEGLTYTWGYSGVEVSNGLFTTPFISFETSIQYYRPITEQIEQIIFTHPNKFYQAMQLLNAKYLVRRNDIDFKERKITNPQYLEDSLVNIANLNRDKDFEQLHFYKISDEQYLPAIYPSNKVILTDNERIFNDILPYSQYSKNTVFLTGQSQKIPQINALSSQTVIKAELASNTAVIVNKENALSELPSIRSTPDRWAYLFIRLKEKIEELAAKPEDKDFLQVNRTGKRLVELDLLIKRNAKKEILVQSADTYNDYLNKLNTKWISENTLAKEALLRQYYVLQDIPEEALPNKIDKIKENLDRIITLVQAFPFDPNFYTYKLRTNDNGEYRVILDSSDIPYNYLSTNTLRVLLDGKQLDIPFDPLKGQIDLGSHQFTAGQHDLKIARLSSNNLVKTTQDSFVLTSGKKSSNPQYPVNNFNPYESYRVSFDYFLRSGVMPELQFISDTDVVKNRITPTFHQTLPIRDKFYDWQSYSQVISPNTSARTASIGFKLVSWNNCEQFIKNTVFWENKCQNKQIRDFYTNSSEIIIKNLRVEKVFDSELIAIKDNNQFQYTELPKISFNKLDPSEYRVTVQNAQQPYILVLSSSFHPLWSAIVNNHKIEANNHQLANGYANSWIITERGNYEIILKFEGEDKRTVGSIITIISVILFAAGLIIFRKKQNE